MAAKQQSGEAGPGLELPVHTANSWLHTNNQVHAVQREKTFQPYVHAPLEASSCVLICYCSHWDPI
jgi:hypothetical protein